jgi:hypothetical protein
MKKIRFFTILLLFGFLSLWTDCRKNPTGPDKARTFESLKKLDDFPLYQMRYYGDYPFENILQYGISTIDQTVKVYDRKELNWACTCFAGLYPAFDKIMGRNFDWYNHLALVLYTDPSDGYPSISMVDISYLGYSLSDDPTLNPNPLLDAPLYPFDGMNSMGLAVGMMAVPYSQTPQDPNKVTIGTLHAIRLMLDYAKTVEEAVYLLGQYNIDFTGGPAVHYIVCDKSGRSAVIEFVNNTMNVIRNQNQWQVSTNFILTGTSHSSAIARCWRYKKAWEMLEATSGHITQQKAMTILNEVSQPNTIWSIVYDVSRFDTRVVMGRNFDKINDIDF